VGKKISVFRENDVEYLKKYLLEAVREVMYTEEETPPISKEELLKKLMNQLKQDFPDVAIKDTGFTNIGGRAERKTAAAKIIALVGAEGGEAEAIIDKKGVHRGVAINIGGVQANVGLAQGEVGSVSIKPVNIGNVAEGIFALGGMAKIAKGGGNITGADVMSMRNSVAKSLTLNDKDHVYRNASVGSMDVAGRKITVGVKINLETPMFNPLFLPGDFSDSSPAAMSNMASALATVVSAKNKNWATLVDEKDWVTLGKMYLILGEKLSGVASSTAKYWNTTGAGGWEDLLKMLSDLPPDEDLGTVWLVADGVEGEEYTTADAWIELEKPVTGVKQTHGHNIVGEFSLKADSAQIAQGGGPGSERKVTRSEETGEILSDKGGGIGIISTKLGVWDTVKAEAGKAVEFFKTNASPSKEQIEQNDPILSKYAEHWNSSMVAVQSGLDSLIKEDDGKLKILTALGALITGGEENLDMKYVDLSQSGAQAKVAFPKSFPDYAKHVDLGAQAKDMISGEVELLPVALEQPVVSITKVEQMPATSKDFDKKGEGGDTKMGYSVGQALENIKASISQMGEDGEFPGAESAAAVFGGSGMGNIVKLNKEQLKMLKYNPPDDPNEAKAYEQERGAVLAQIQKALVDIDPEKVYSGVRDKVNSLLPKVNDAVFVIRWKLRVGSSAESRTYLEKRHGLVSISNYTKYLAEVGAEADESVKSAVETIVGASAQRLLDQEEEEAVKKTKKKK
jgi:hypothetical protein